MNVIFLFCVGGVVILLVGVIILASKLGDCLFKSPARAMQKIVQEHDAKRAELLRDYDAQLARINTIASESLNKRQIGILLALACVGKLGLSDPQVLKIWGSDGTEVDKIRFRKDMSMLDGDGSYSAMIRYDQLESEVYGIYGESVWLLSSYGKEYLIKNKII